jgi:hypothetical protein
MATDSPVQCPPSQRSLENIPEREFPRNKTSNVKPCRTSLAVGMLSMSGVSGCADDPEIFILHRAHEAQECFAWQVKSVANIAAIVSPAASVPIHED